MIRGRFRLSGTVQEYEPYDSNDNSSVRGLGLPVPYDARMMC